jgi:hypothetical protein
LVLEYFYLVFIAAVGVIQAAVAYNGLRGVSFFSHRVCGYFFAAVTIGPVLASFFAWNERNPTGVVEGGQQFYFFMLAIVAAIGFTLVLSSIIKHHSLRGNDVKYDGFEALKEVTFFQAIRHRFIGIIRNK